MALQLTNNYNISSNNSSPRWMDSFWTLIRQGSSLIFPGCLLSFSYSKLTLYPKCCKTGWSSTSSRHHQVLAPIATMARIWWWCHHRSIKYLSVGLRATHFKWETPCHSNRWVCHLCHRATMELPLFFSPRLAEEMIISRLLSVWDLLCPEKREMTVNSVVLSAYLLTTSHVPSWNIWALK